MGELIIGWIKNQMNNLQILFGVCGIGKGHIYEMLPIIENYVNEKTNKIVIFAFGVSYSYFKDRYLSIGNVEVFEVKVPWIHGAEEGLDYLRTANDPQNRRDDYIESNFFAMDQVKKLLGQASIVITDYEPISALYAYSMGLPIITVDQQSKYLFTDYLNKIDNLTPMEERARLGMFFPHVDLRIITSFFKLPSSKSESRVGDFLVCGSVIRDEILNLSKIDKVQNKNVLVYLSPYSDFVQSPHDTISILKQLPAYNFFIFTAQGTDYIKYKEEFKVDNVYIENYGDNNFTDILKKCDSVICTAGHTLLSELMYLGKPVLAIPLATYEQQYSAWVINDGKFGATAKYLTIDNINNFLSSLEIYKKSIELNSENRLYRQPAQFKIIETINNFIKNINSLKK